MKNIDEANNVICVRSHLPKDIINKLKENRLRTGEYYELVEEDNPLFLGTIITGNEKTIREVLKNNNVVLVKK